jgi:prepilin-type N-terminal cleavage/methylation domain-containing protein
MRRRSSRETSSAAARPGGQAGVTLVEVLVAIFVMGVGLLALLTLFPLGALELAQAIEDDRTAAVAAEAETLSQAGTALVSRTMQFVMVSLSSGSADPQVAAELREQYEDLAAQTADLEVALLELQSLFPPSRIQRHLAPVLARIRSIKPRIDVLITLLTLVER